MKNFCFAALILFGTSATAQDVRKSSIYVSPVDDGLDIRRVTVLPVADNVSGIYSRPVEQRLTELLEKDHHWDFVEAKLTGPALSPAELEDNPEKVKELAASVGAEALVTARVTKGPDGISMIVDLFLGSDGLLISQERVRKHANTNTNEVQEKAAELTRKALANIPYSGVVLSRDGNRVTTNLGKRDGVRDGQVISIVQIIKVNRHPKYKFIVSTEKEVLGKVKLEKIDETLSFGLIITETERGVIQKRSKVSGIDSVIYAAEGGFRKAGAGIQSGRSDSEEAADKMSFGEKPKEWVPVRPPTFGKVGVMGGLGSYLINSTGRTSSNATLSMTSTSTPIFNIKLGAEIWLTPKLVAEAQIRQGVFSAENPRGGSLPSNLNFTISNYTFLLGYNFLILDDFFGPKIQLLGGFTQYHLFVDQTSPTAYTSMVYRGMDLGLRGSFPVDKRKIWQLGAGINLVVNPAVSETPVSSGASATNTVTNYSIFGTKRVGERLEFTGTLDFELYGSDFGGQGTRSENSISTSQRMTTGYFGVNYLF